MRLRPANAITFDNYRWALRHTLRVADRSRVGRWVSLATVWAFAPAWRRTRDDLREALYQPLP